MKSSQLVTASFTLMLILAIGGTGQNQRFAQTKADQPAVVVAVAPAFIGWIFNKTGVGQAIVEVRMNAAGEVTSAKSVEGSPDFPWGDHSFEQTAMRWRFSPATDGAQERVVRITFVLRIMPKGTHEEELAAIYSAPYQIEVRHEVFEPYVNIDPMVVEPRSRNKNKRP